MQAITVHLIFNFNVEWHVRLTLAMSSLVDKLISRWVWVWGPENSNFAIRTTSDVRIRLVTYSVWNWVKKNFVCTKVVCVYFSQEAQYEYTHKIYALENYFGSYAEQSTDWMRDRSNWKVVIFLAGEISPVSILDWVPRTVYRYWTFQHKLMSKLNCLLLNSLRIKWRRPCFFHLSHHGSLCDLASVIEKRNKFAHALFA